MHSDCAFLGPYASSNPGRMNARALGKRASVCLRSRCKWARICKVSISLNISRGIIAPASFFHGVIHAAVGERAALAPAVAIVVDARDEVFEVGVVGQEILGHLLCELGLGSGLGLGRMIKNEITWGGNSCSLSTLGVLGGKKLTLQTLPTVPEYRVPDGNVVKRISPEDHPLPVRLASP